MTWSAASQAVGLASIPILSRLFSPDAYGLFALYSAVSTMLVAVLTFRIEWHIPNCRSRMMAGTLAIGALSICFLLVVSITLAAVFGGLYRNFLPAHESVDYAGFFALAVGISVMLQATEHVAISFGILKGDVTRLGKSRFIRQLTMALCAMTLFLILPGYEGLVAAAVCGLVIAVTYLVRGTGMLPALRSARTSIKRLRRTLRAVSKRAAVSTLVSANNAFSYELIPVVLIAFYSPAVAGLYFMSRRLLAKPVSLVASSMSSSFWAYAAAQYKKDPLVLRARYLSLTGKLALMCIPFAIVVWIIAQLAPFILGDKWNDIPSALLAVVPMSVGTLVFSGLGHLIVLRKQHYQLFADTMRLVLMISAAATAAHYDLAGTGAILLLSSSSLIGHFVFFGMHLLAYRNNGLNDDSLTPIHGYDER